LDGAGGYVKLLAPETDQAAFDGDSSYSIMFGPDICGYSTKKVHAILNVGGENKEKKEEVKATDDKFTHSYLLVLNADDTYSVEVDGEEQASGSIQDAWEVEQPKEIKDPDASKPEDWVDSEFMDDPQDVKPADWENGALVLSSVSPLSPSTIFRFLLCKTVAQPEKIPDPQATTPQEWDAEEDGEWEAED